MTNEDDGTRKPARSRFGLMGWLLFLLGLAIGVVLYQGVYVPLERERERLESAEREARSEADRASGRLSVLEPNVETLTAERDALRAERDRLAEESGQLASTVAEREAEIARLESARTAIESQLHSEIAGGDISVEDVDGELRVRLADQILFAPGSADLSTHGQEVLRRVAATLSSSTLGTIGQHVIEVGGHTDDTPLSEATQERFPTNWELSTARATHVVRFLQDQCAIPGERLVAAGYSQYRPATELGTPAGRRRNRRIELRLRPPRASDAAERAEPPTLTAEAQP